MTVHSVCRGINMACECILQKLRYKIFTGTLLFCILATGSGESNWDLRLVGSRLRTEGRVEVYLDGEWGTITDANTWGEHEAQTVCKQLGFPYTNVAALEGGYYGQGTGKVHLSYVSCQTGFTSLDECTYFYESSNIFGHEFDAAVTCKGEIRLQGSKKVDSLNGIIQILYHNQWFNLCTSKWTEADSEVACRRLGYPVGRVVKLRSNDVSTSLYKWDYNCKGNEKSLDQCPGHRNSISNCQWHAYFLTCTDESSTPSTPQNSSTFTLSTISGSLGFLVVVIAVLLVYLISIKKRSSRHRRWITLAGGRQQCQPSERDGRRLRTERVRGRNQRRSTPTVNSISNGQRGNDRDLPSYSRLEEDTPPPYSQLPLPRIEIPVVGREERYEERAPRYTETDAVEFFQELDAEQLRLQYENAAVGPSQPPHCPAQPAQPLGPPPNYDHAVDPQPERAPPVDHQSDIDNTSHAGSISSDDEGDDISLSHCRTPIPVIPKDTININATVTSVEA